MKRASLLSLESLIKLTIALVLLVFVFIPLGVKLYDIIIDSPDEKSLQKLDDLGVEIQSFVKETERLGRSQATVPYYVAPELTLIAHHADSSTLPQVCKKKNCLCLHKVADGRPVGCVLAEKARFTRTETPIVENKRKEKIFYIELSGERNGEFIDVTVRKI